MKVQALEGGGGDRGGGGVHLPYQVHDEENSSSCYHINEISHYFGLSVF